MSGQRTRMPGLQSLRRASLMLKSNHALIAACWFVAIVITRYIHAEYAFARGSTPSVSELIITYMSADASLSGAWLLCPALAALLLSRMWEQDSNPAFVLEHGAWRRLWATHLADTLLITLLVATTGWLLCLLLAFLEGGPLTGGPDGSVAPALGQIAIASYAFLVSTTAFSGLCFGALRWIAGSTAPAFIALTLLALPTVHGPNSFVYDIVRNIPGLALFANPLHSFYTFSSIDWERWTYWGPGMRLWFLPLVSLMPAAAIWIMANRRELMGTRRH